MYSIRRKFASLHQKGIPTGDPNCPEEVHLAKRIKYDIGHRLQLEMVRKSSILRTPHSLPLSPTPMPLPRSLILHLVMRVTVRRIQWW